MTKTYAPRGELERAIMEAVRVCPDVTTKEIADLCPDFPHKSVTNTVSRLARQGRLLRGKGKQEPVGDSGKTRRNPTYVVATMEQRAMAKKGCSNSAAAMDLNSELAQMRQRMAELEQFQREALERHPDLAVPAEVLRARLIVAQVSREHDSEDFAVLVETGKRDESAIMQATIRALEEGMD